MQFNSSFQYGVNNCEPNYQQNLPLLCNGCYPKVVGEGDVTSVVLPDGTIQCYFIPTSIPRPPNLYVPNSSSSYPFWTGAWFVRSISNSMPPLNLTQQCQRPLGFPCFRSFSSMDFNMKPANDGFQLKFHNDCWTSTTDLHYFYPSLRRYDCFPKTGAAVQVETPMNYEFICNKPCNCVTNYCCRKLKSRSDIVCDNTVEAKQDSSMSIESDEKGYKCKKCELKSRAKKNKSSNKMDTRLQVNNDKCKYEVNTSDKLVSTYEDQASGCNDAKGCETQTACGNTSPVREHDARRKNMKLSKSRLSKKAMDTSPDRMTCGSDCSTCSNNCCGSDIDDE